ncbi:hypothetical protein GLOIN_2v1772162 [Rhizophagus irregularis DAOM 181602=DAOM 197198]|nr:hypothetical protein GLOIN_2v1772162 [Rhizophagus irregularis DAOM 181602=DAOM 197198]
MEKNNEIEFPSNNEIYNTYHKTFESLVDYVFIPGKSNNSGFDMIIAINIECKFSYPDKKNNIRK